MMNMVRLESRTVGKWESENPCAWRLLPEIPTFPLFHLPTLPSLRQ